MKMRYILGWLLAILFVADAQAEEHLRFLGVPMDGTAYSFCKKLIKRGFTVREMDDAKHPWEISLTGMQEADSCIVVVSSTPRSHRVYEVRIGKLKHQDLNKMDANATFNNLVETLASENYTKFKNVKIKQREVKACEAEIWYRNRNVGTLRVVLRRNIFDEWYSVEIHFVDHINNEKLKAEQQEK